jgi:hypothetical protein
MAMSTGRLVNSLFPYLPLRVRVHQQEIAAEALLDAGVDSGAQCSHVSASYSDSFVHAARVHHRQANTRHAPAMIHSDQAGTKGDRAMRQAAGELRATTAARAHYRSSFTVALVPVTPAIDADHQSLAA